MTAIPPEFTAFLNVWDALPRVKHPLLPSAHDIVPHAFGELLACMALTEMLAPQNLKIFFIGSRFEMNASLEAAGKNYYDLLPDEFHKPMAAFHKALMGTPCGAYVCDAITTSQGNSYTHETVQMPYTDSAGDVRFLLAYGHGRKPYADTGERVSRSHTPSNIKELRYIDLGAGTPTAYVENFTFHAE